MHSRPKLHAPATQVRDRTRPLPLAHALVVLLYASSVVLYSQCELCDVRLPVTLQYPVRPSSLPLAPLARRRIDCHGKTDAAYGANCGANAGKLWANCEANCGGELRGELRGNAGRNAGANCGANPPGPSTSHLQIQLGEIRRRGSEITRI